MDEELKEHLQQMEGRTNARLDELRAYVERVETTLLTEFHKWASPAEMRARSHSAALRAMDIEIEALSERVEKLEKPGQQH
ncbi:MAG: hypothetical protein ABSG41_17865 [Bryobacteraceae bacterium]